MGATLSQPLAPPNVAGFFYAAAAPIPTQWRSKSSLFVLGRGNPAGNPGQNEAAAAGGLKFIYFDLPLYYKGGTYDVMMFNANSYGPAFTSMGGGNAYGPAVDLLSNTSAFIAKMDAVIRKIKADHPNMKGIFADDSGPDWTGYDGFSAPTKASIYTAWVAIAARYRALADELGFIVICNGEWRGDRGHGYPATNTYGCSYMDGFCVEGPAGHTYDAQGAFWKNVDAGQWRLRDPNGRRANLYISPSASETTKWAAGDPNLGWIAQQSTYDTNPSAAVSWGPAHDLGISFTGQTPSISVSISPQNVEVEVGTTKQFTATVTGATEIPIWYVNGIRGGDSTVGTITSSGGLYTAPATVPTNATVSITAKLTGGQTGATSVTIKPTAPAPPPTGGTPPAPPAALPGTFQDGNRFVGTTPNTGMAADTNRGCTVFFDQAGTITSLSALIDGLVTGAVGSQSFRYVVYADAAGEPGALLGVTADGSVAAGANPAWIPLTLTAPITVQPGTTLHFHIHSGTNVVGRYWFTPNTGVSRAAADTFVGGAADPFPASTAGDADISIFATATATGITWDDGTTASRLMSELEAKILSVVKGRARYWLTDFGASVGSGSDDSAVFQAAIDKANSDGGGVVRVPRGTYKVAAVTVKSGVFLDCEPGVVFVYSGGATTNSHCFEIGAFGSSTYDQTLGFIGYPTFDFTSIAGGVTGIHAVRVYACKDWYFQWGAGVKLDYGCILHVSRGTGSYNLPATDGHIGSLRFTGAANDDFGCLQVNGAVGLDIDYLYGEQGVSCRLENDGQYWDVEDIRVGNIRHVGTGHAMQLTVHNRTIRDVTVEHLRMDATTTGQTAISIWNETGTLPLENITIEHVECRGAGLISSGQNVGNFVNGGFRIKGGRVTGITDSSLRCAVAVVPGCDFEGLVVHDNACMGLMPLFSTDTADRARSRLSRCIFARNGTVGVTTAHARFDIAHDWLELDRCEFYDDRDIIGPNWQPYTLTGEKLTTNQQGLETDTTGWSTVSNASLARDTGTFYAGAASLKHTLTTTGSNSTIGTTTGTGGFAVSPGDVLTFQARCLSGGETREVRVEARWYDAAGATISTPTGGYFYVGKTHWTHVHNSFKAPAGAAFGALRLTINGGSAVSGEFVYWDAMSVALGGLEQPSHYGFWGSSTVGKYQLRIFGGSIQPGPGQARFNALPTDCIIVGMNRGRYPGAWAGRSVRSIAGAGGGQAVPATVGGYFTTTLPDGTEVCVPYFPKT